MVPAESVAAVALLGHAHQGARPALALALAAGRMLEEGLSAEADAVWLGDKDEDAGNAPLVA